MVDAGRRQSGAVDTTPPGTRSRRQDIQGLRAVAVGIIVAFHAGAPLPGGFVGVDVFFVISGFVITAVLLRDLDGHGSVDLVGFYSRRARRLLPALALMVVTVAIASAAFLNPVGSQQAAATTGMATSVFAANVDLLRTRTGYFDPPAEHNPLLHTWSLGVEEQFYLLFPVVLALAWRLSRGRRRRVAALLGAGCAGSFALAALLTQDSTKAAKIAFYASPARAWEFGAGAVLALAVPALLRLPRRLAVALGAAGVVVLALTAALLSPASSFPGPSALLPVLGTALLLVSGTATAAGVPRLLGVRPLVWLGDLSYGWYLWHWPAIVFTRILWPGTGAWVLGGVAVLALLPAWLSFHRVEQPFRTAHGMVGRPALRMAAVALIVPATACAALFASAGVARSTAAVQRRQAFAAHHAGGAAACDGRPVGRTSPGCTWTAAGARGRILLVGDSNAVQFTEPAARAANDAGYDLTVATFSECPFVDLRVRNEKPSFKGEACRTFIAESLGAIENLRPALVVIASSSTEYLNPDNGFELRSPEGAAASNAELWEAGLSAVLRRLHGNGVPAAVVHTVPHFRGFRLDECPALRIYLDAGACGRSLTRAQVEAQQGVARAAESRAVAAVAGAVGVDFTDDLCSPDRCATGTDGFWLYRDGFHLSVAGALTLTGRFDELFRGHARPEAAR